MRSASRGCLPAPPEGPSPVRTPRGPALAVAGGADHDALAGALAGEGDPRGEVLGRIDRLPVAADQQAQVVALDVRAQRLVVLLDVDLAVDVAGLEHPVEQLLEAF